MLSIPISHFTKASSKYVKGYQLFDKVKIPDGREGFIFGRRSSGYFNTWEYCTAY